VSSILEAIGNTPLVRLQRLAPENEAEIWLKLEYRNPSGSMKDRMALAMIEGAERDGLIAPGDTIVEFTGGSTGPALALVCAAKGYRPLIVMADCFTEERFQLTRALGGEIDVVPSVEGRPKVTPKDVENMVARAAELAERPGHYWTDQFNSTYTIPGHRDQLGREIWEQTAGGSPGFARGSAPRPRCSGSRMRFGRTESSSRPTSLPGHRRSVAVNAGRFSSRAGAVS
jgi:cysteine synthase A